MKKILLITAAIIMTAASASAQKIAVKGNLLYGGGTFTPNLGVEIRLGQRSTLDLWGGYNPWERTITEDDGSETVKRLKHFIVSPEYRFWINEPMNGHFFGVHGLYGQYDITGHKIPFDLFDKEFRYDGSAYGGGLTYGYQVMLGKRWGLEFSISGGYVHFEYDKYNAGTDGELVDKFKKSYFGPTKAGITLVFLIK